MKTISELFEEKVFITDLGVEQTAQIDGKEVSVGRFAVFSPNKGQEGHQAIEVSNDSEYLCKKYKLTKDSICMVNIEDGEN